MKYLSRNTTVGAILLLTALPITAQAQTCTASTRPDSRYTVMTNGTEVKDNVTGLIWQRCSLGQTWSGTTCIGTVSHYNWQQALTATNAIGNGYRLPNIKELNSLVDDACYSPAINERLFPNTAGEPYWSSSPSADTGAVWIVEFYNSYTYPSSKSDSGYVRAVRSQ
ncbi:MAG: DUF1566 domain-containing protein [Moraxella sp.]|nr:DUF1566 domain-containing protein [Moraxella sp.]